MKKRLTSLFLVLALSFSLFIPVFAVDDNDFYSLPSVASGEPSLAIEWPVTPASDAQLASIIDILGNISKQITTVQSNQSVLGKMIQTLTNSVNLNGTTLNSIFTLIQPYESFLSALVNKVATETTLSAISDKVSTEATLKFFSDSFDNIFSYPGSWTSPTMGSGFVFPEIQDRNYVSYMSYPWVIGSLYSNFLYDGFQPYHNNPDDYTLYHFVKNLSLTLASDDDKHLAENYKDNRNQAESDFLSGQSGKTSLGKGDFSNASQVGGALNDTFNMGGTAKVSDFLSGFGSAGSESQAWFSQITSNNLNAVEAGDGTSGVSTFADDCQTMVDVDPDPYNMADIFSCYDWLEGVEMDD